MITDSSKYRILVFFIVFLAGNSNISGQVLDHVLGEVLIEMHAGIAIEALMDEMEVVTGKNSQVRARKLNTPVNSLWTLHFDHNKINENKLLEKIRNSQKVKLAQFNHLISFRNIPNDPQFVNQWQYINTGASGGKIGADIDMDLAWDITTGGVTVNGDTIVACVIDGGMDANHNDFGDNLWVNYGEVPDNGIDDDLNGYTDDYYGWNTSLNIGNDNVFDGGSHGTPVAGIIGAKGNNGIGVAGVNWDVKLMIIKGGGNEAEALEAYNYPYVMRKKYNETNGAEGAFVVTTNASWGTDLLDWQDAPIWCSFYDSLGTVGIMNCAATANNNYNIDELGDMPTSCPSDYLISVTNMNRKDEKVFNAGYGQESIDLGAFGENTWTTKLGNVYGTFGGTSGATPHVAGAVALAYSLNCTLLADLALSNPSQAVLLIRDVLLSGVDPNQSLEGITTTGGRLNVNNSLVILEGICGDCSFPLGIDFDTPGGDYVNLSWDAESDSTFYDLIIREKWTDDWDTLFNIQSPLELTGLEYCTDYEIRLKTICEDDSGTFSFSYFFSTDGCCVIPSSHQVSEVSNGWEITLEDILATDTYTLQYRKFGTLDWISETKTSNIFAIPSLDSCFFYTYRFKSICSTVETDFSPEYKLGYDCPACEENVFCELPLSNFFEFIDTVTIGPFVNVSGSDPNAYGKYDQGNATELKAGQSYHIEIVPGFENNTYDEYIRVFIDLDQNGAFDEAEEVIYLFSQGGIKVSGNFEIPTDIDSGYSKMRIIMAYKNFNSPCDQDLTYGEVEDYCVYLNSDITDCLKGDFNADTTAVGLDFASLAWNDLAGTIKYFYRYRQSQSNEWIEAETQINNIIITGLDSCSLYEFELGAECSDGTVNYKEAAAFYTDCSTDILEPGFGSMDMSVFPNPFADAICIYLPGDLSFNEPYHITIYDIAGKILFEDRLSPMERSGNKFTIDRSRIKIPESGIFLIKVSGPGGSKMIKAIGINSDQRY